jgi:hypothetical protein
MTPPPAGVNAPGSTPPPAGLPPGSPPPVAESRMYQPAAGSSALPPR